MADNLLTNPHPERGFEHAYIVSRVKAAYYYIGQVPNAGDLVYWGGHVEEKPPWNGYWWDRIVEGKPVVNPDPWDPDATIPVDPPVNPSVSAGTLADVVRLLTSIDARLIAIEANQHALYVSNRLAGYQLTLTPTAKK